MENFIREVIKLILKDPATNAFLMNEISKVQDSKGIMLSSICIDTNCDIYLPDYNNAIINIPGYQNKALYIFYLFSLRSLAGKDLINYKEILKRIYQVVCQNRISNMNDEYRSERVIQGLFKTGAINHAVYDIKEAVKKVVPEDALKYYLIKGKRNCPRSIALPKSLIRIENDNLKMIYDKWEKITHEIYWKNTL